MKRIRLLPLVLIAVSALLAVKVLGFVMGVEPLGVGPQPAVASGAAPAEHGEAAAEPAAGPDTSAVERLTAPISLADEYKKLKEEQAKGAAGHGGGHGEAPAAGHGETPADTAEGNGHEATSSGSEPAAGHEPTADGGHAAAPDDGKTAEPAHGEAHDAGHEAAAGEAPADAGHAAPAEGAAGHEAPAADDAGHGAPAGEGHGAPEEGGGHGAKPATDVYTERPKEYSPPIGSSERAILEGLATRRDGLDKRAHDLDLRAKLLEAAEQRLNERLNQLQSIETQLGVAGGGGASAGAPSATDASAAVPATAGAPGAAAGAATAAGTPPAANEQLAALVSLYEGMKPKAAAAVFDKLDNGTLLELATHMNPRKLSPIMAAMDPEKASRITGMMIGAQQAQKRVVVQVEQVAPTLGPVEKAVGAAPAETSQLPQIMPAQPSP